MERFNAGLKQLNKSEIRRYAGLHNQPFRPELTDEAADLALLLSQPQGVWQEYAYHADSGELEKDDGQSYNSAKMSPTPLGDGCFMEQTSGGHIPRFVEPLTKEENASHFFDSGRYQLTGQSVRRHLQKAARVVVLAVTIGEAVENEISRRFAAGDYSLALLLDAAATTAVEQTADNLERALALRAGANGFALTARFSPGYGDWDLNAQTGILPLSGGDRIGISLTEGLMLLPRKSVTAVIGLVPKNAAANPAKGQPCPEKKRPDCKNCPRLNCPIRSIS